MAQPRAHEARHSMIQHGHSPPDPLWHSEATGRFGGQWGEGHRDLRSRGEVRVHQLCDKARRGEEGERGVMTGQTHWENTITCLPMARGDNSIPDPSALSLSISPSRCLNLRTHTKALTYPVTNMHKCTPPQATNLIDACHEADR